MTRFLDYPELVQTAAMRVTTMNSPADEVGWVWFQCASGHQRAEVDAWVVKTGHALGFEPGSAEQRFRALVKEARAL